MQDVPPSFMLPELPRRQSPMPPTYYNFSGLNMSGSKYSRSTIRFRTPETMMLDQNNVDDDYRLDANGFLGPLTNPLDQKNFNTKNYNFRYSVFFEGRGTCVYVTISLEAYNSG